MREGDVGDVDEGKARFVRLIKVTPGDDGAALASGGPEVGVFKEGEVSKQRETTWVKEEKEQKGKTRKRMRDGLGGGKSTRNLRLSHIQTSPTGHITEITHSSLSLSCSSNLGFRDYYWVRREHLFPSSAVTFFFFLSLLLTLSPTINKLPRQLISFQLLTITVRRLDS